MMFMSGWAKRSWAKKLRIRPAGGTRRGCRPPVVPPRNGASGPGCWGNPAKPVPRAFFQDELMSNGTGDFLAEVLIILLVDLSVRFPAIQGNLEHLVHGVHQPELEDLLDVLRDVRQVLFVVARQDDGRDAHTVGRQDLLLDSADRQDLP